MANKLLRTDLPPDVWQRLDEEARAHGRSIGVYLKDLIVARDKKRQARVSRNTDKKEST